MHRRHVSGGKLDRRVRNDGQLPVCEDPARHVVRPPGLARPFVRGHVREDPLVRRRAHGERADLTDEFVVIQRPGPVLLSREQPVERMVRIRNEAVETRRRVVLRRAHVTRS